MLQKPSPSSRAEQAEGTPNAELDAGRDQPGPADPTTPTALPPFVPMHPARAGAYMFASLVLALTQGLGMSLVTANIPQIGGSIGATTVEANWLVAAYMAPNVSMALALIKIRTQYGLRNFAELSLLGFVIACVLNLFISDLPSAIVVRFMSGIVAAPLSTLAFLYMLEPLPPQKKLSMGLSLALTSSSLGAPLARIISPALFDIQGWHGVTILEVALAMIGFCFVYLLPLTPQPRAKVIERLDVVSYILIAVGFGSAAIALVLGRLYWWFEAPWLGLLIGLSIIGVSAAAAIELNRKNPLLDIRWLASPAVLHFTGALLVFRIVLSEQTTGASGLFQMLGLINDQTIGIYWVILAASVAGGLVCAFMMKPGREAQIYVVALTLLTIGALMDSQATNLTRPSQMYLSQALIAFAGTLFLPPAMLSGLMSALKKGPNYILSFVIVFLTTQSIGGLLGSAVFSTFITIREKFHSNMLVEHLVLTDPVIAQRVTQLGSIYAPQITDKALLNAEGIALLGQQATREANVLAYNDAFLLIAAISATALVLLLIHMAIVAVCNRTAPSAQPANP